MIWRGIDGCALGHAHSFGIMGIVNLTPDSFSGDGLLGDTPGLLGQLQSLVDGGADMLDIGAESTRPGAWPVPVQMQLARLVGPLALLRRTWPQMPISVDTRSADVAAKALEMGATVINDVSGLMGDEAMLEVVATFKPGFVLMHSQGTPRSMQLAPHYGDVVEEVRQFFWAKMNVLVQAGLPEDRIILDPGLGFGKNLDHNLELIRHMRLFLELGRPILVGISRKSMLGALVHLPVTQRDEATAVASALLYQRGVQWHRVHNALQTRRALQVAEAFLPGAN